MPISLMHSVRIFSFAFVYAFCFGVDVSAQSITLTNPLEVTPSLAGNYGELRPNHFHAGIDLKTGGREGLPIHSVFEGHVSRIKVSPYGYGKALYIDHPNGYTTVYAHLSTFSEQIEAYIHQKQYELQSFEVDVYPGSKDLLLDSGQIVAYSGNTGGSAGPHLHFEIRETTSEVPRNPLLFNFPISDSKKPEVEAIAIEPLGENARVNGKTQAFRSRTKGNTIMAQQPIQIEGAFGVALRGYDSQDGSYNHNGIYQVELLVNDRFVAAFKADSISFAKSRHLNALIDYHYYYYNHSRYMRLYRLPGNQLENLRFVNDGRIELAPGLHTIKIISSDVHENQQLTSFEVKVSESQHTPNPPAELSEMLEWNVPYLYESNLFKLYFPQHTVYDNYPLELKELGDSTAPKISILDQRIPIQEAFQIEIKIPASDLEQKGLIIAQLKANGQPFRALSTSQNEGWLRAESRSFGVFGISVDDTDPIIRSYNFSQGEHWDQGVMKFKVSDNFSGVHTIDAYVDEQWVLAAFEPKQDLVSIDVRDIPQKEVQQELKLIVTDMAGNVATFDGNFYRK